MIRKIVKQTAGIDVAQKELVVTLGRMYEDLNTELYAHKVFKNKETGFVALLQWIEKLSDKDIPIHFVMEATGVYHQKFAYYLAEKRKLLSIILPNKVSNYMRTLNLKTITDKSCSEAIAQFGLERKLDFWKRPKDGYRKLQQLTRERDQIVQQRCIAMNQLHAEKAEAVPHAKSIRRIQARIKFFNKQEDEIKNDIDIIITQDECLKQEVETICTIPSIGKLTAVIILAETNGFELIRNKKQLTSYAGLDVKEKQSGTSVKGKPRISKKGNRYIRKAMHLPAIVAIRFNKQHRELFARLTVKSGIKMKGIVAVQRKLLELIYIVHKNKSIYNPDFEENRVQLKQAATL